MSGNTWRWTAIVIAGFGLVSCADPGVAPGGEPLWSLQFGTAAADLAAGIAIDATGRLIVGGTTGAALDGVSAGGQDAFVRTYGPDRTVAWTHQFGSSSNDVVEGVAVLAGGQVAVAGFTFGALEGTSAGGIDAFLRLLAPSGAALWTRQFGTADADVIEAVATDDGGRIVVVGSTGGDLGAGSAGGRDAFVRVYAGTGTEAWSRQFGSAEEDFATGVAAGPGGRLVVVGGTRGAVGGTHAGGVDGFVHAYDADGTLAWAHQFGTGGADVARGVAVDPAGDVVVVGSTDGDLAGVGGGGQDLVVRRYDRDGAPVWTRQLGTGADDFAVGVAASSDGRAFVSGITFGDLAAAAAGEADAFVLAFDADGGTRWTRQFGTPGADTRTHVATSTDGTVAVAGSSAGDLAGVNAGDLDVFVRGYSP